jgi:Tol biopolymer transport system component
LTFPEPGGIDLSGSRSFDDQQIVFQRNGNLWLSTKEGKEIPLLENENINSQPTWSTDPEMVIFSSSRNSLAQIWQISTSTGELEQLTYGEISKLDPVVNGDGVLSYHHFLHTTDLFSINMDGLEVAQLTFYNGNNFHPRISPDGEKLVYQSDRTGNLEIWMLDLSSGEEINLSNHSSADKIPDWSPDGKQIVFLSQRNREFQLMKLTLETMNTERLTQEPIRLPNFGYDYAMNVRWSPDGKSIGYLATGDTGRSLWVVDQNGENQRVEMANIHSFDWYQGSNKVIYNKIAKSRSEKSELRIRNFTTGKDTLLYSGRLTEIFVKADGSGVGFIQGPGHWNMDVFLLPLKPSSQETENPISIGEPIQLTNGEGKWHAHNCAWSPDGNRMIYVRDEDVCNIYQITGRKF